MTYKVKPYREEINKTYFFTTKQSYETFRDDPLAYIEE